MCVRIRGKDYRTVWFEKNALRMIDQRLLPHSFKVVSFKRHADVAKAIRNMVVRMKKAYTDISALAKSDDKDERPARRDSTVEDSDKASAESSDEAPVEASDESESAESAEA